MVDSIAFLYPGQGSQKVGMGANLYETFPEAQALFDQADEILGFSLKRLCFQGPETELNQDINAQLAVYVISCCITDILKKRNILPQVAAGYSSGFYGAAYCAGCFDFSQGLEIVKIAGETLIAKGSAVKGAMAVIFGISIEELNILCKSKSDVEIAIINTPRQIIISGLLPAVEQVMEKSISIGALDAYLLPAKCAYHSTFMLPAGRDFLKKSDNFSLKPPMIPLIPYHTLTPVENQQSLIKVMADQLSSTVRWVELIQMIKKQFPGPLIEIGPGAVICGTVRWIDRNLTILNTSSVKRLQNTVKIIQGFESS